MIDCRSNAYFMFEGFTNEQNGRCTTDLTTKMRIIAWYNYKMQVWNMNNLKSPSLHQSYNKRDDRFISTWTRWSFSSRVRHGFPGWRGSLHSEQNTKEHFEHCALLSASARQLTAHLGQLTTSDIESNAFSRESLSQCSNSSSRRSLFNKCGGIETLHLVSGHANWNKVPSFTCILHKVSMHLTQNKCWQESLMKFEPNCFKIKVSLQGGWRRNAISPIQFNFSTTKQKTKKRKKGLPLLWLRQIVHVWRSSRKTW